jgi:hypothetical protein
VNKFFRLFLSILVLLAIQNNFAIATENIFPDQKKGKIKHVYVLKGEKVVIKRVLTKKREKSFKAMRYPVLYVLEDGFTISHMCNAKEKKKRWQTGDELIFQTSFSDLADNLADNDDFLIEMHVQNKTKKQDNRFMGMMGWIAPYSLTIVNIDFEKVDGDKIITLTLSDDTQWKIVYFDETAYAKKWQMGEKVLLFIEPSAENITSNPFLSTDHSAKHIYGIINLDSVHPFAGEPVYPAF